MKNKALIAGIVVLIIILIGAVLFFSHSSSQTAAQKSEIILGFIGPLTGDGANLGISEKNAIEMALDEINSNGGINGSRLSVIYEDGKCSGQDAVTAVQKLVTVDDVKIILGGTCSAETLAVAPITEQNKIILFSAFSSSPKVTDAGDYVFRMVDSDTDPAMISKIMSYMSNKSIALLSENTDYSIGIREGIKRDSAVYNISITGDEVYAPGEKDFRTYLLKIKSVNPDIMFVNPGTSEEAAGVIAKQAKELGLNVSICGNFIVGVQKSLDVANGTLEGAVFFDAPMLDEKNKKTAEFMKTFRELYGDPPSFWEAGSRYDSVYILRNALEKCGEDTNCIRDFFYSMDWYDGVVGRAKFDKNGDVLGLEGAVKKIENGKPVTIG